VHLTPRVPRNGPVTTLCGQTLPEGSYAAFSGEADCANCIRRSRDSSRISGAFFAQEEGSELLRLSLEQARLRKPAVKAPTVTPSTKTPTVPPAASRPVVWPSAKPPADEIPDRIGELVTRGFKPAGGEGVWRSPGGVVVRMKRKGRDWRFEEVVFEGSVVATRTADGLRIRAGDVEVAPSEGGLEILIKKR
jgi:hypothetical protein